MALDAGVRSLCHQTARSVVVVRQHSHQDVVGGMSLRYATTGNRRPHEVSPRSHRRDSAWQAHIHGTTILPMEDDSGFLARLRRVFG